MSRRGLFPVLSIFVDYLRTAHTQVVFDHFFEALEYLVAVMNRGLQQSGVTEESGDITLLVLFVRLLQLGLARVP